MELYNKLSKKERIQLIEKAGEKRLTICLLYTSPSPRDS